MADSPGELSEAARRAVRRAGVHFLRAAIELVQGFNAAIQEIQASRRSSHDPGEEEGEGRQHIELE